MLNYGENFMETLVSYLDTNIPNCGLHWSAGGANLFYQITRRAGMYLAWNEYHKPDPRFRAETDRRHFRRKHCISRLHNLLCTYALRCLRSDTDLAGKLRYCTCLSETPVKKAEHLYRCRNVRLCPFCLFLDRAVPLYEELVKTFGNDPEESPLRLYHFRLRPKLKIDSPGKANEAVRQLQNLRGKIQDCSISRNCLQRWSVLSLTGNTVNQLSAAIDLLYVDQSESLKKFTAVSKRFPETYCTMFYCVHGTKHHIQQRLGTFLQYPVWYLTAPFNELENYLQTDFFRTRLSAFNPHPKKKL